MTDDVRGAAASTEYPDPLATLAAIRALTRKSRGTIRVVHALGGVNIPGFRVEAKIFPSDGPDLEIEVSGTHLAEAAFNLLEIVKQVMGDAPA